MNKYLEYFIGTIKEPEKTFNRLQKEKDIKYGGVLVLFFSLLVMIHITYSGLVGQDWLRTRQLLSDPALVLFFGHSVVNLDYYLLWFFSFTPVLNLIQWIVFVGFAYQYLYYFYLFD